MGYFAPYVDSTGFHCPSYSDILEYLTTNFKVIYGQDCYLGNDAADYQWISIVAKKIYDVNLALQLDYNNRSVSNATGTALDGLVKNNGLIRKSASYSTCVVTLYGVYGTEIVNGVVQDLSGNYWDLTGTATIGIDGTTTITAICRTIGSVTALPNSINSIVSNQAGWTSVTNLSSAILGLPVETDAQIRARQALSTSTASHTTIAATIAAIAAVENVTRYNIHENPNSAPDELTCPAHSITCVVEGGLDEDVAMAIYLNRGIGCNTNGTTDVAIIDPDTGESFTVSFTRPTPVPIYVTVTIEKYTGYTDAITTSIEEAIAGEAGYLNTLQIGQDLATSALSAAIMAVTPDLKTPLFSITSLLIGKTAEPDSSDNISIAYNEVTIGYLNTSPIYIKVIVEEP